jgi:hypothetical protein
MPNGPWSSSRASFQTALALEDGCLDLLDTVEDANALESFLP